jgi:glycosyltransferase involved in cell wall biosynthesis
MTHFSLIVATMGRVAELRDLFDSLVAQDHPALDIILVDQNPDDRLAPVVAEYAARLALRHLRSPRPHANAARNLGLRAAIGDIVAFPDDDCTLPAGTLARVAQAFRDAELQILTGPSASPGGGLGSGRWHGQGGPITLATVWTSVIEFNLWLRRDTALELGGFDENLGPGSPFGSAEGNDLVCRALAAGMWAQYDPALLVVHPDKRLSDVAAERAYRYGMGLGFVLRRHEVPFAVWSAFLYRPVAGAGLSLLRGRLHHAAYYWQSFSGRLAGYLAPQTPPPPGMTA